MPKTLLILSVLFFLCTWTEESVAQPCDPPATATLMGGGDLCDPLDQPTIVLSVDCPCSFYAEYEFTDLDGNTTLYPVNITSNPFTLPSHGPGTYELISVDYSANNCDFEVINESTPLESNVTATMNGAISLCTGETGLINVEFTGLAPMTFVYEIDGVEQPPVTLGSWQIENGLFISAGVGTYTPVSITQTAPACEGLVSGTVEITEVDPPTATIISGGGQVCESSPIPLTFELTGEGPWTLIYELNGIQQFPLTAESSPFEFYPTVSGTYELTGVSDANCTGDVTGEVVVEIILSPSVLLSGDAIVCEGESVPIHLQLTGLGPWSAEYAIDGVVVGNITADNSSFDFFVTEAGTYTITALSDDSECDAQTMLGDAEISFEPIQTAEISGDIQICEGGTGNLTVDLEGVGPWEITYQHGVDEETVSGITTSPYLLEVSEAGTYTLVSVTNADSDCLTEVSGTATVEIIDGPTATISGDASICEGEAAEITFTITGDGPWDVVYDDGTGPQTIPIASSPYAISVTDPVTYTLLSVSEDGCNGTASGSATITVNSIPNAGVDNSVSLCSTDDAVDLSTLLGGGIDMSGTWTDPDGLAHSGMLDPDIDPAGDYTYSISSDGVCPAQEATIAVSIDGAISVSGLTENCDGFTYTITFDISGGDASTYSVSGDSGTLSGSTFTSDPIASGTSYSFDVEDGNGCNSETVSGSFDCACPASATLSGDLSLCSGDPGELTIDFVGNPDWTFIYAIDGVDQPAITTSDDQYLLIVTGEGTYTLTSMSDTDCEGSVGGSATVTLLEEITVSNVSEDCNGTDYTVTFDISGGDAASYSVSGGAGTLSGSTFTSDPIASGMNYSFDVEDGNGCNSETVSGSVNCDCPASADLSGDITICEGSSGFLTIDFEGTGPWDFAYTIDGGAEILGSASDDPYMLPVTSEGEYLLTTVNDNDCQGVVNGTASVNWLSGIEVLDLTVTCTDGMGIVTFDIIGGDPSTYQVMGPAGELIGSSFASEPMANGTFYGFDVIDGPGCGSVVIEGLIVCDCDAAATLSGGEELCEGEEATLTIDLVGDPDWTIVYAIDGVEQAAVMASSTPFFLPASAEGVYTLVSVSDGDCEGTVSGMAEVTFLEGVIVSNVNEECNGAEYTVTFDISGGDEASYSVSGGAGIVTGSTFTSDPIVSGTPYDFIVEDGNGCNPETINGTFDCSCPASATISGDLELCEGDNGTLTIDLTGNAPWEFVVDIDGIPQAPVTGIMTASYDLIVDQEGSYALVSMSDADCAGSVGGAATVTFFEELAVSNITEVCEDGDYTVTFDITGGDVNTYQVIGGTGVLTGSTYVSDFISSGLPYSFEVTDENGCNVVLVEGTESCFCLAEAAISGDAEICAGESTELTIDLLGTGPWEVVISVNGIDQAPIPIMSDSYTFSTDSAGIYALSSVTDATCMGSVSGSAEVVAHDLPAVVLSGDAFICEGEDAMVDFSVTAEGSWTIDYEVDGVVQTQITASNASYQVIEQQSASYVITSISDDHCTNTEVVTFDVSMVEAPSAVLSGGGSICEGDMVDVAVDLTGNGPWTMILAANGINLPSVTTSGDFFSFEVYEAATYTIVSVSDAACDGSAEGEVVVEVLASPSASISGSDVLCEGELTTIEVVFEGSGSYTFDHAIDGISQGDITTTDNPYIITTGTEGEFTLVEVADDNCPGAVSGLASIEVEEIPTADLSGNIELCDGEVGELTIDLGGNGDWEVDYTLDGVAQPTLNAVSNITLLPVTEAGEYVLTAVSDANCTGEVEGTATVEVFELPTAVLSGDHEICEGGSALLDVTLTGQGPWWIEVSDGSTIDQVSTTNASFSYPVDIAGNYSLEVISDANCEAVGSGIATLLVHPLPTGLLSGEPVLCEGESGILTVELEGTAGFGFVYAIDGLAQEPMTSSSTMAEITTSVEGQYELLEVTDLYCEGTASGELTVESVPLPTAGIDGDFTICEGAEVGIPIDLSGTGDWLIEYTIDGLPQPSVTATAQEFILLTTSTGLFELGTVSDANCANDGTGSAEVAVFPPIEVDVPADTAICTGQVVILEGGASGGQGSGYVYTWTDPDGVETSAQSIIVEPSLTSMYTLSVTDDCGVLFSDETEVVVNFEPPISIAPSEIELCGGAMVQIDNTTPPAFWEDDCYWTIIASNGLEPDTIYGCESLIYQFEYEGSYGISLHVSSAGGCSGEEVYPDMVQVDPRPLAYWEHLPESPTIIQNEVQFFDRSHNADEYSWYLSETMEEFSEDSTASYLFPESDRRSVWTVCEAVSNEYGCVDTLCLPIVIDGELIVWMPTAFTPDADGLNELFKPTLVGADPSHYTFRIFDRWGDVVWETDDLDEGWNGKGRVEDSYYLQDGLYSWELIVRRIGSSESMTERGRVTVLR